MGNAAHAEVRHHPYWKKEYERLEFRLGRSRAIVAIARHLLIAVWHILAIEVPDRHADATSVAVSMFKLAYEIKLTNLPDGMSARAFTRQQMDRLGIRQNMLTFPWGSKNVKLPPSILP